MPQTEFENSFVKPLTEMNNYEHGGFRLQNVAAIGVIWLGPS
jgi:hypothetical protein